MRVINSPQEHLDRLEYQHLGCCLPLSLPSSASNAGSNKRQITDLVDQSIQITSHCFVVTADNRYILVCGFWDKSFRVYSSETGTPPPPPPPLQTLFPIEPRTHVLRRGGVAALS